MSTITTIMNGLKIDVDNTTGTVVDVQPVAALSDAEKQAEYERAKKSTQPVTLGMLLENNEVMREFVIERVNKIVAKLNEHTDKIKELEERPTLEYVGVFDATKSYAPGNFVTHGGAVWHCNQPTSERPGESNHWRLAVKKGRNARDGKLASKN